MTMAVDNQQRHPMGGSMGYDQMHYPQTAAPQFNNPWTSAPSQGGFQSTVPPNSSMNYDYKAQVQKPTSIAMPYSSMPATAPTSYPTAYSQPEMMNSTSHAPYDSAYSTAPPHPATSYAPTSGPYAYAQSLAAHQQDQQGRRISNTSSQASSLPQSHSSFGDAIEASRGMVAMAQNDVTPRNIYGRPDHRGSLDSYGFPSAHSTNSSISSASGYGGHYGYASSVDGSATDYSSASESVDGMSHSRTLPRPSALLPGGVALGAGAAAGHLPPAPASMMGSFNSKVSSSAQKKHKCKICDKRFTRPSSLQTHMYSHTGEKPFQCEVPGCGRNFSVVSNLRRHRKVHKNDGTGGQGKDDDKVDEDDNEHEGDQGSPDGSWTSGRD